MPRLDPELQCALTMFSRFFDLIHQPLAVINHEGKYVYYNQESAELDGYTINQALGRHMLDVYPQMKESQSTMLTSLKKGVEYIGHYQIYTNARGQAVDYQHTTAPLYGSNGNVIGAIEVGRNLSGVRRLQEQVVGLNKLLYAREQEEKHTIITENPGMLSLIEKAKRLAASNVPVMIVGETGTGKELFAHLVYHYSKRAGKPFIALNCGALPATLIESTLFGTVKGAFTGAENNQGYLELADGGTLFLDELNAMPLEMQSKLLRFLQDKTFWKLGGNRELRSDVRIVAAMNVSPARLIEEGKLRSDLFYRLSIGMLQIPALAERPDDVLLLSRFFIDKYRDEMQHDIQGLGESAAKKLILHTWPGNVRMLENTLVRSMIMQEGDGPLENIIFEEESPELPPVEPSSTLSQTNFASSLQPYDTDLVSQVEHFEQQLIRDAINRAAGRIAEAARELGISRTTLHYKVKKYGIRLGVV
ncbi:PAS domain S-box protein [Klebsiella quasipneumoniae subsp. similipneumoniae]|uniref:sigma-54 interaction domain-containing protein n=1 Tax=Klebsiella quasipneumoniae TaxID=1463165 RepID=UPI000F09901C|nr:sigma 54-interacting transcriptional regulator [Klebsiella quasipneumoniae]RND22754.1 PAS domain S-box protein [Klebsiella quasipneumoniae subsp. similipneumoniae]